MQINFYKIKIYLFWNCKEIPTNFSINPNILLQIKHIFAENKNWELKKFIVIFAQTHFNFFKQSCNTNPWVLVFPTHTVYDHTLKHFILQFTPAYFSRIIRVSIFLFYKISIHINMWQYRNSKLFKCKNFKQYYKQIIIKIKLFLWTEEK